MSHATRLYEAYRQRLQDVSRGDVLTWSELPEHVREAWSAVSESVLDDLNTALRAMNDLAFRHGSARKVAP